MDRDWVLLGSGDEGSGNNGNSKTEINSNNFAFLTGFIKKKDY